MLAVSSPSEASNSLGINGGVTDNSALWSGAAYLFARNGGVWSQQAYIKAPNTEAEDRFGQSVALAGDGSVLAVGAYQESSNATGIGGNQADNSATGSGAVYLY